MGTDSMQIAVERTVEASAAAVFAFLADPANHASLDTSGMVRGTVTTARIDRVGAVFVMDMADDRRAENHVVVYEPDRAIGWAPAAPGEEPAGHTWTWRMAPLDEHRALVGQIYDWSGFTHLDVIHHLPVVNRDQLRESLDRLAAVVSRG